MKCHHTACIEKTWHGDLRDQDNLLFEDGVSEYSCPCEQVSKAVLVDAKVEEHWTRMSPAERSDQPSVLIAQRLQSKKAHRFLIRAVRDGLVKIHRIGVREVGVELNEGVF